MSSTFLQINKKKDLQSFKSRLTHNLRKKNLSTGPVSNSDFQNIIKIDDRKKIKEYLKIDTENIPEISRTDLSKKIAKLNQNLKNAKKEKTKDKLTAQISVLKEQRNKTTKISTAPPKNQYFELNMSITDVRKDLKRNKDFAEDFSKVFEEWFNKKLPNAKKIGLAAHLDQGNPHVHLNFMYASAGDNNITNDLKKSFGNIEKNYLLMQKDFNKFVKEHKLLKKYDLEINEINQNGRKNYIPAEKYKLLQQRAAKQAKKAVNNYINTLKEKNSTLISFDKDKVINQLQKALINEKTKTIELSRTTMFFKNLEIENEKLEKENKTLKNVNQNNLSDLKQASENKEKIENIFKDFKTKIIEKDKTIETQKEKIENLTNKNKSLENTINQMKIKDIKVDTVGDN